MHITYLIILCLDEHVLKMIYFIQQYFIMKEIHLRPLSNKNTTKATEITLGFIVGIVGTENAPDGGGCS